MNVLMLVLNDMTADARVDREAAALAADGHDVTVLALRSAGLPERERVNRYTILRAADYTTATWKRPLRKLLQAQRRKAALLRAGIAVRPDVVHAHDTDTLAVGSLIAETLHAPLVYDAHELYPDMVAEFRGRAAGIVRRYWRSVERRIVPRATGVVTVSEGLAGELRARFGVKPVVVRNVPPLVPLAGGDRLRGDLGLVGDPRAVVLYQGVLISGRGLVRLVDAVAQVPGIVLAVQGFGREEDAMRERAGALGVADRVRFMGKKAPVELHAYACGADFGVVIYEHTTLNNYLAGPNKLYAYLMAGLPVVASRFPGLMEVVEAGDVGRTFDPADADDIARALSEMASEPDGLARMGARARELAEMVYNWDVEKQALLDLYDRLSARSTS